MAGIFDFLYPTKPGKGISKDEPPKSHFAMFFVIVQRKFVKLVQLNLLFVLFSIPIITIGPAAAAMTRVLRDYTNELPVFLLSDFWDAFKSNFKQSLLFELLAAPIIYLIWIAWQYYNIFGPENQWMDILMLGLLLVIAVLLFAGFYIFLQIVTIELPLRAIIKNSFMFAALGIKSNLATLLFGGLTVFILWYFYMIGFFVYVFIGFSFVNLIIVHNSYRVVKRYAIDPYLKGQQTASGEPAGDGEGE